MGAAPPGAPSSRVVSTLPGLAVPTSFTVTVALPAVDPLAAVTVNWPAPPGLRTPPAIVASADALVVQAAHPVTSIVLPSANVPVALRVTGCGACGYVTCSEAVAGVIAMRSSPAAQSPVKAAVPPPAPPSGLKVSPVPSSPPAGLGVDDPRVAHPPRAPPSVVPATSASERRCLSARAEPSESFTQGVVGSPSRGSSPSRRELRAAVSNSPSPVVDGREESRRAAKPRGDHRKVEESEGVLAFPLDWAG